jgi:hypothetical protein
VRENRVSTRWNTVCISARAVKHSFPPLCFALVLLLSACSHEHPQPARLHAEATTVDFGLVDVETVATKLVAVANQGDADTTPLATLFHGDDAFVVVNDGCFGKILAPKASCAVEIEFAPLRSGPRSFDLSIVATTGGTVDVAIHGKGRTPVAVTVIVDAANGSSGKVSSPEGTCTDHCDEIFDLGSDSTLTATAGAEAEFVGWDAPGCKSDPTCTLTPLVPMTVTAHFRPHTAPMIVEKMLLSGASGHIASALDTLVDCGDDCSAKSFPVWDDKDYQLVATPAAGYELLGWSGDCVGRNPTCVLKAHAPRKGVVAVFGPHTNYMFAALRMSSPLSWGGLDGADSSCRAQARLADLPSPDSYVALLASSTSSLAARFASGRGWVRLDGLPIADKFQDLIQSGSIYPVAYNGTSMRLPWDQADVFTGFGVDLNGNLDNCKDFSDGTSFYTMGAVDSSRRAVDTMSTGCNSATTFYCLGTAANNPITMPKATGRYAFVSDGGFAPGGGVATADALCQKEADAAHLPGTYLALLATTSGSAMSRFSLDGPRWIGSDGQPLGLTAADFVDVTRVWAAPHFDAAGKESYSPSIWLGANGLTRVAKLEENCGDWTVGTAGSRGLMGESDRASAAFYTDRNASDQDGHSINACNRLNALVCLQQ